MATTVIRTRLSDDLLHRLDGIADAVTDAARREGRLGIRDALTRSEIVRAAVALLVTTSDNDPDSVRRRLIEIVTDGRAPGHYDLGPPAAITPAAKAGGEDGMRILDRVLPPARITRRAA